LKILELTDEELRFIYSYIKQAKEGYGYFVALFQEKGWALTSDLLSGLPLIESIENKIFELDANIKTEPLSGWNEDHSIFTFAK
jgi:hypothetical protein